jgi:predicted house-cleaning noncanonical NTP pyrophosphatase (MazG superfamily)
VPLHRKLVRDLVPAIIQEHGEIAVTRVLEDAEYGASLFTKLREEADELRICPPQERLGELADVLEVVRALAVHYGHSLDEVVAAADDKAAERGGFEQRLWLEETTL